YSLDFYQLAKDRLTDEGVVVQWIPLHTQSNADTRMLVATFLKAFPNSSLWWTESGEALMLGRMRDAPLPPGHFRKQMLNANVARSLKEININSPEQLAAHYLLGRDGLQAFVGDSAVMTDEFPIIEYRVPTFNDNYRPLLEEMIRYRPESEQIAKELGLSIAEATNISNAWMELKSSWY
ncbi:hypothetical protein MNBD_GAMMA15-393, partial [hydrothermal vent metagenome]